MLSLKLQSLIAARYPRRYVGRHRARFVIRFTGPTIQRTSESGE